MSPLAQIAVFLLLGLAWLAPGWVRRRRGVNELPQISDEEFLLRFGKRFSAPPDRVLESRGDIAGALRVPAGKLAPEHTPDDLRRQLGLSARPGLGWQGLDRNLLLDLPWLAAGFQAGQALSSCPTVGDLIALLVRAQPATPSTHPPRPPG